MRFKSPSTYCFLLLILLVLVQACNPNRNRRINRSWHTLTGHYNVYFNGEQKLATVTEGIEKGTVNDFSKLLPVFCYGDEAGAKASGGQLDEVIKKASLSIQNHTVGQYTDDSYLLMGKSHFFKRDYYAALEAFQYVNSRYKDNGLRPLATAWIAKCYVGLKKNGEAEAVMGLLLSEFGTKTSKGKEVKPTFRERMFPPIPKAYFLEIYTTAADVAIKQEKYAPAAGYLKKALQYTSRKTDKIRYTYLLGQLMLQADSVKHANKYFSSILSMNAPYDFEFNASINLAKAYDPSDRAAVKRVRRSLKRMLKDDKNDGMYDKIYYELGNLEMKEKNLNEAIRNYKLSVGVESKNPNQKALGYLALGNIYLDQRDYILAQAYYDSTSASLSKEYKDYSKIIAKGELLSELISNLVVIETEDSLQALSKLSNTALEAKIDSWILAEKMLRQQQAKEAQRKKALAKMAEQNQPQGPGTNLNQTFGSADASWYFYNPALIASGAADFFSTRKWGRRANQDFWRLSAKEKEQPDINQDGSDGSDSLSNQANNGADSTSDNPLSGISSDRQGWVRDIPFSEEAFQKSRRRIIDAYYNIGVLYDEKLNDNKESSKAFETLNDRFPGNGYEPEVLYRLYKLASNNKDSARANYVRATLITKYPESPYALILQNKHIKSAETDANKEVVAHYEKTYQAYLEGNYMQVKSMKLEADKTFPGNNLTPKFDLLYALAIGKTDSIGAFKKELEHLIKTYAKTDVGERAQTILNYIKKQEAPAVKNQVAVAEPDFLQEPTTPHYFIFATKDEKFDNNEGLTVFNKYNEEFASLDNLRVNNYVTQEGYQLIMIREFGDYKKSLDYLNGVETLKVVPNQLKYQGKYLLFVISVNNFKKMLKEQKLDAYVTFFNSQLPKKADPKN